MGLEVNSATFFRWREGAVVGRGTRNVGKFYFLIWMSVCFVIIHCVVHTFHVLSHTGVILH